MCGNAIGYTAGVVIVAQTQVNTELDGVQKIYEDTSGNYTKMFSLFYISKFWQAKK
jgi:hypothetical protein